MRNLQTIAIAVMLAVTVGIVLGVWAGIAMYAGTEARLMREEAIACGVARYRPDTGEFEYRFDLRAPAADVVARYPNLFRECPSCQGAGVIVRPIDREMPNAP